MAFKDNREFIVALEKTGDIVRVRREVDWDLEVGAIIRRLNETEGPAAFFQKIKNYPGHTIFGTPLATFRRMAVALGLPADTPRAAIQQHYESLIEQPIKPIIVRDAPCKENIIKGKNIDLYEFPAPMVHEGDGGRYIGTWHVVVGKDPDSEWVNWGMYRLQILGRRAMGGVIGPWANQFQLFYGKYVPRGQNMPFAIAIGADPVSSFLAASYLPPGASEADYAGGLRQEPVELIKCETNDLYVPAYAEIILEGEILKDVTVNEGPFGEYVGYRAGPRTARPVYQVNCITHRNNPILTVSNMGLPIDDCALGMSISLAYQIKKRLRDFRIPFIDVNVVPEGITFLAVVSTIPFYSGIANQIAHIASQTIEPHMVIVVNNDVDVFDIRQVLHALATKCHPVRGIRAFESEMGLPFCPYLKPEERRIMKGARVVFDCTWPLDWPKETAIPPRSSFNEMYPQEIKDKVLANWKKYGFKS